MYNSQQQFAYPQKYYQQPYSTHQLQQQYSPQNVIVIDLSAQNLAGRSYAKTISDKVYDYCATYQDREFILNLYSGHFLTSDLFMHGTSIFDQLFECDNLKYIIIVGNPAATIDSMEYFSTTNVKHLEKLIWVQPSWIQAGHWKNCISNSAPDKFYRETTIEQAHNQFARHYEQLCTLYGIVPNTIVIGETEVFGDTTLVLHS
jgi:hypothetical protein